MSWTHPIKPPRDKRHFSRGGDGYAGTHTHQRIAELSAGCLAVSFGGEMCPSWTRRRTDPARRALCRGAAVSHWGKFLTRDRGRGLLPLRFKLS